MDRLPWSRFHWLVVVALGIIWILDGLEVTIVGSLSGILQQARTLGFSSANIGFTATSYLTGAVLGSLFFGYLTDRLDRKKLFNNTLVFYLSSTALTAFSWDLRSFAAFRFLTGAGIGGEYSAINSAIDELIPARVRGTADLIINGSLGGGGTRFRRVTDLPERKYISRKYWLAAGLRPRSVPRTHSPRFEAVPPGEPAMAHDPREDHRCRLNRPGEHLLRLSDLRGSNDRRRHRGAGYRSRRGTKIS